MAFLETSRPSTIVIDELDADPDHDVSIPPTSEPDEPQGSTPHPTPMVRIDARTGIPMKSQLRTYISRAAMEQDMRELMQERSRERAEALAVSVAMIGPARWGMKPT